jgi:dihydroflavonol-4-reductase
MVETSEDRPLDRGDCWRGHGRARGLPVARRPCDITRPDDLANAIPRGVPALFHLAADRRKSGRRRSRQEAVNVEGTRNVLNAAIASGVGRLLYTSSMGAFGLHRQRIDETTASNALKTPVGYFRTKHLGEIETHRAIERGLDAVIVNPSNVMGPRNIQNMTASFIRVVHAGTMPVIGPGAASFCHVREVARAMIACIERGRTSERHLLGGADATFLEFARAVVREVGGRVPRPVPAWMFRALAASVSAAARIGGRHTVLTRDVGLIVSSRMLVDTSKAVRDLGYRPVPLSASARGWSGADSARAPHGLDLRQRAEPPTMLCGRVGPAREADSFAAAGRLSQPVCRRPDASAMEGAMAETAKEAEGGTPAKREEGTTPFDMLRREIDRVFEDVRSGTFRWPFRRPGMDLEVAWPRPEGWQMAPATRRRS